MEKLADFKDQLTPDLIMKYERRGSFYTDYPTLGLLEEKFGPDAYRNALKDLMAKGEDNPVLWYLHFPFCAKLCYYCQCSFIVTNDYQKQIAYLEYLFREIDMLKDFFDQHSFRPNFKEIHLGGGTPSYMRKPEFDKVIEKIKTMVDINQLDEFAIEVDIRTVDEDMLKYYAEKGCNRLSLGIQDFDLNVQKAINRVQPYELVDRLLTPTVRKLYRSLNFDLIYGMPCQTREAFRKTIEMTIKLSPDRLTLYSLGYRPDIYKHQTVLKKEEMPTPYERMMIGQEAIQQLVDAGYQRVGLDHFAKETDDLGMSMKDKRIHRNAIGYTPGRCTDMIGIGPSSMSRITDYYYFQNFYELSKYQDAVAKGDLPIFRGYRMRQDDIIRRDLTFQIMNFYSIDFREFEEKYDLVFRKYFAEDLELLQTVIDDGFVIVREDSLEVTPLGKCFLRFVCEAFDKVEREGRHYVHSRQYRSAENKKPEISISGSK